MYSLASHIIISTFKSSIQKYIHWIFLSSWWLLLLYMSMESIYIYFSYSILLFFLYSLEYIYIYKHFECTVLTFIISPYFLSPAFRRYTHSINNNINNIYTTYMHNTYLFVFCFQINIYCELALPFAVVSLV